MEEPQPVQDLPQIAFKKRSGKAKSRFRKRAATPPPASDSGSDFVSSDDDEGHRIKRRRKNVGVTASSASAARHEATGDTSLNLIPSITSTSDDAIKSSNWYDEDKAGDLTAKNLLGTTRGRVDAGPEPDGTYKGTANYQTFIQKNPDRPSKQVGPVKAATNVRTITITDFAPDVCKDYKQTGFCGFGDNCKYLHAREDYKHGWELDRDWEIGTKGKKVVGKTVASANRSAQAGDNDDEEDDALLESIPFACIICKKPYTNPIVTKCGHYFCEACALQRYRKNPSCAACGAGTGGVFNVAKKLSRLLEKKRERAQKRREKAIENGEEVSEEEDVDDSE